MPSPLNNSAQRLHTAARRYCIENHERRTHQYFKLIESDGDRRGPDYTPEALEIFPRYNTLHAILVDLERLDPIGLDDVKLCQQLLIDAGATAQSRFTEKPIGPIDEATIADERSQFQHYVKGLDQDALQHIEPLPYRRVLSDSESTQVWNGLADQWSIERRSYWFPPAPRAPKQYMVFVSDAFYSALPIDQIRSFIADHGIDRIWELREYGPEYTLELDCLHPYYTGAEGFWTSQGMQWVMYASHENTVTVTGWLLDSIQAAWPDWRLHTFGIM